MTPEQEARVAAQKLVADAIILERAVRVLERTSRLVPLEYPELHWFFLKDTLRQVAQVKRLEAEIVTGTGSGHGSGGAEGAHSGGAVAAGEG